MSFRKWVAWSTLAICIAITLLTGCGFKKSVPIDAESYDEESMFVICESCSFNRNWNVVYHKDTKVMYAVSRGGYNSGNFTLLVNPDGSPMLWEGDSNAVDNG